MKYYVTFGQVHTHRVNGQTLDCDSVAVIEAVDYMDARERAFELFDREFFTVYENVPDLMWFPRGLIHL